MSLCASSGTPRTTRGWLLDWWDTCEAHLQLPADDIRSYREALLERFTNPRIRHRLDQIAADGSQKLPIRILPVLRRERVQGRLPTAATITLAAWVLHLGEAGVPVKDVRSAELQPLAAGPLRTAVPRVLASLDPSLADDVDLVAAVRCAATEVSS